MSITKSLTKARMAKLKQAKETYRLTNVSTNDDKIHFKSGSNVKAQFYYS